MVYALALSDLLEPEGCRFKRISSLIRTFVVLMAAALCALSVLFIPARTLWNPTRTRAAVR